MALTDYEKKVLEQMEAELAAESPGLAKQMSAPAPQERGPLAPRRIAAGGAVLVIGLLVLIGAVSLGYSAASLALGVVGFALMTTGILYALSRPKGTGPARQANALGREEKRGWDSFIEDQERRWDDRRDND